MYTNNAASARGRPLFSMISTSGEIRNATARPKIKIVMAFTKSPNTANVAQQIIPIHIMHKRISRVLAQFTWSMRYYSLLFPGFSCFLYLNLLWQVGTKKTRENYSLDVNAQGKHKGLPWAAVNAYLNLIETLSTPFA